jgi:hypothetical protein
MTMAEEPWSIVRVAWVRGRASRWWSSSSFRSSLLSKGSPAPGARRYTYSQRLRTIALAVDTARRSPAHPRLGMCRNSGGNCSKGRALAANTLTTVRAPRWPRLAPRTLSGSTVKPTSNYSAHGTMATLYTTMARLDPARSSRRPSSRSHPTSQQAWPT